VADHHARFRRVRDNCCDESIIRELEMGSPEQRDTVDLDDHAGAIVNVIVGRELAAAAERMRRLAKRVRP
jgi:hypothetical protein